MTVAQNKTLYKTSSKNVANQHFHQQGVMLSILFTSSCNIYVGLFLQLHAMFHAALWII
jgi:hypothetical protein